MIVHEIENGFASVNSSEKMVKEAVLLDANGFSLRQRTLKTQRNKFGFEGPSNCTLLVGSTAEVVRQTSMLGR
jgi:hypothetical protein